MFRQIAISSGELGNVAQKFYDVDWTLEQRYLRRPQTLVIDVEQWLKMEIKPTLLSRRWNNVQVREGKRCCIFFD